MNIKAPDIFRDTSRRQRAKRLLHVETKKRNGLWSWLQRTVLFRVDRRQGIRTCRGMTRIAKHTLAYQRSSGFRKVSRPDLVRNSKQKFRIILTVMCEKS